MPGEREDFPIARVAALARLELSPSEEVLYQAQLRQILDLVGQVAAAAVDSSTAHGASGPGPVAERPDAIAPSLPADAALANAPDASQTPRLIRVPKVIG
jgi:aspartyl-tRNA(Asn)/glutamyl-tRNA(Gln) amidotransferase subunit C